MSISNSKRQQILKWLGQGYGLKVRSVNQAQWNNRTWRTEWLCKRAASWYYHVYDEPAPNAKRRIVLAYEEE